MDKHPLELGIGEVVKTYELLDRVRLGKDIVVRDDQFEAETLLDAAREAHAKGIRVGLIDTGRFDAAGLERLIREHVRFYTSDEARPRPPELARILKACRKARSFAAYFQNGALPELVGPITGRDLLDLARDGLDFHISNLVHPRDFAALDNIADEARFGRAFFVYYHHGPLDADIVPLAARGAWVHFSDRSVRDGRASELALKIAEACRSGGSRAILYIQEGLPLDVLRRLFDAGAAVLFHTPPSDHASLFRPLERRAAKRRLPVRSYYLSTTFLL